jgi:hypothetical protein
MAALDAASRKKLDAASNYSRAAARIAGGSGQLSEANGAQILDNGYRKLPGAERYRNATPAPRLRHTSDTGTPRQGEPYAPMHPWCCQHRLVAGNGAVIAQGAVQ